MTYKVHCLCHVVFEEQFETLEEAREYAKGMRQGELGSEEPYLPQETFTPSTIIVLDDDFEEVDRWTREDTACGNEQEDDNGSQGKQNPA